MQVRGELKKGATVIDTVTGNWMHSVEWEKVRADVWGCVAGKL